MTSNTKVKTRNAKLKYYVIAALVILAIIGLIIVNSGVMQDAPAKAEIIQPASQDSKSVLSIKGKPTSIGHSIPTKGKIIQPAPQHKIEQLRKSLGLPEHEEEEKGIKQQMEEILKKYPNARFIL